MKTKEKQNILKAKTIEQRKNLNELHEEDLMQVTGGAYQDSNSQFDPVHTSPTTSHECNSSNK